MGHTYQNKMMGIEGITREGEGLVVMDVTRRGRTTVTLRVLEHPYGDRAFVKGGKPILYQLRMPVGLLERMESVGERYRCSAGDFEACLDEVGNLRAIEIKAEQEKNRFDFSSFCVSPHQIPPKIIR